MEVKPSFEYERTTIMTDCTVTLLVKYSKYNVNIPRIPELSMPILNSIQNPYCCVTHLVNQGVS